MSVPVPSVSVCAAARPARDHPRADTHDVAVLCCSQRGGSVCQEEPVLHLGHEDQERPARCEWQAASNARMFAGRDQHTTHVCAQRMPATCLRTSHIATILSAQQILSSAAVKGACDAAMVKYKFKTAVRPCRGGRLQPLARCLPCGGAWSCSSKHPPTSHRPQHGVFLPPCRPCMTPTRRGRSRLTPPPCTSPSRTMRAWASPPVSTPSAAALWVLAGVCWLCTVPVPAYELKYSASES